MVSIFIDNEHVINNEKEDIQAFQRLGSHSFFSNEDDDINWEDVFEVKNRHVLKNNLRTIISTMYTYN